MFNNPKTLWIEILVIALVVAFLTFVLGRYIYRKTHHLPTGECECCHSSTSKNKLVKDYKKTYHK